MKKLFYIGACILLLSLTGCVRTSIPTGYVALKEPVVPMEAEDLDNTVGEIYDSIMEADNYLEELHAIEKRETWLFNGDKVNINQVDDFKKLYEKVGKTADAYDKLASKATFPSLKAYYSLGKDFMTLCKTTFDTLNTEISKTVYEKTVNECVADWDAIAAAAYQAYIDYYTTTGDIATANYFREYKGLPSRGKASWFENRYGTMNTVCKEKDCMNLIAEDGDTAYCAYHSCYCEECGCYIDKGYKYCVDCAKELGLESFDEMKIEQETEKEAK